MTEQSRTGRTAMKRWAGWWQRFLLSLSPKLLGECIYLFPKMSGNKSDNADAKEKVAIGKLF